MISATEQVEERVTMKIHQFQILWHGYFWNEDPSDKQRKELRKLRNPISLEDAPNLLNQIGRP